MWKLVIEDDEARRTVVPLSRDAYDVGRAEENAIRSLYAPSYAAVRKTLGPQIDSPDWRKWFAAEGV